MLASVLLKFEGLRLLELLFVVIRYVGRLFVKGSAKPAEILTKLNELVGFAPDEEIELFEVFLLIILLIILNFLSCSLMLRFLLGFLTYCVLLISRK